MKLFSAEGRVQRSDVIKLTKMAIAITFREPNTLVLKDPINIVGDIHGQFHDLCKLLRIGKNPKENQYLFLGDYVDRGNFSCEVLIMIMALKVKFPGNIFLLRGNHECRQMTTTFNFRNECLYKFDQEVYNQFMEFFDSLSLAAVVNGRFFVVHGGISPELNTISTIDKINRFVEISKYGLFCDILWSDPVDNDTGTQEALFQPNKARNCSFLYGLDAVKTFLDTNKLMSIIRAHEVQYEGYKMSSWGKAKFPMVITIFSAPNYCQTYKNKGAIIKLRANKLDIEQFKFKQTPYYLPDFMNLFEWSIPFVSEKILELFVEVYQHIDNLHDSEIPSERMLKVINELSQDDELHDKFKRIFKSKEKFTEMRRKSESKLSSSILNRLNPTELDYD